MPGPRIEFRQSLNVPTCKVSTYVADWDCVVIWSTGEFDLETRGGLLVTLAEQPWRMARTVIVDLTHVTFCDAHVAGALVALGNAAADVTYPSTW